MARVKRFVEPDFTLDIREHITRAASLVWPGYPPLDQRIRFSLPRYRRWVDERRPADTLLKWRDGVLVGSWFNTHPNYQLGLRLGRAFLDDGVQTFHDTAFLPSYEEGGYPRDSRGVPVHPYAETLFTNPFGTFGGPAFYWNYGPNRAADPVVLAVFDDHLHWLAILREDYNVIALPGGHEEPGSTGVSAAMRELLEETNVDISSLPGKLVYQGVVGDERATLNAWPETSVYVFMPPTEIASRFQGRFQTQGGETRLVTWRRVTTVGMESLFASHAGFIKLAVREWEIVNHAFVADGGWIL